ncbi:MAG: hypothetical protein ACE5EC_00315 [Phycisphaerae bacterium]
MMRKSASIAFASAAILIVVSGCGSIDLPAGYIKVKNQWGYDLKGVSARGNVIALNSRPNEDKSASLEFWSEAIAYQKVDIDGMKLAKRESIRSQGGRDGVLFHFEAGEGRVKTAYLVALYVTPMRIYTVEATGPEDAVAKDMDKLRRSMLSMR